MIIPNLVYADALSAIDWLCSTFGFTKKLVVPGGEGLVAHAQLTLPDNAMVMISSMRDDEKVKMKSPNHLDGYNSQGIYVVVPNAEEHYKKTHAAGAKIIRPLVAQEYGGQDYTCLDCEGNIWSFGTYDPRKD